MRLHPLVLALPLACPSLLLAADVALDAITVSAVPLHDSETLNSQPISVVQAESIHASAKQNLSEALSELPGVHAAGFGVSAGRPVIRGFNSENISIVKNGLEIVDASRISPDHAIAVEPVLSKQLELLEGPATLLYGGGLAGGVVNVIDDTVPSRLPAGQAEGFVTGRSSSASQTHAGGFSLLSKLTDSWVYRVQGFRRDGEAYRAPGQAEAKVDGTQSSAWQGSVGTSWLADWGYVGVAHSQRRERYGLPGHDHVFHDCVPVGATLQCNEYQAELAAAAAGTPIVEEEHSAPEIDLRSERTEFRAEVLEPMAGVELLRVSGGFTDYRHAELEDGAPATSFVNRGYDLRAEASHKALAGLSGTIGATWSDRRDVQVGESLFLPTLKSNRVALFALEHLHLNDSLRVELAARYQREGLSAENLINGQTVKAPSYNGSSTSLSSSLVWQVMPDVSARLTVSRLERLPNAQELYAKGLHLASNTYECGLLNDQFTCGGAANDANIRRQVAQTLEWSVRKNQGAWQYAANVYDTHFDDYIYARTLNSIDSFRLIKYTQADARFTGADVQTSYAVLPQLRLGVIADTVRARLDSGSALPRISPMRSGLFAQAELGNLALSARYYYVSRQSDREAGETATPSHNLLNLTADYHFGPNRAYSLFARADNLLDEVVYQHTSFLANRVPEPGRSITAGFRVDF